MSPQDSTLCAESSTSHLEISSSPETKDIILPETVVTTSSSENEHVEVESSVTNVVWSEAVNNQEILTVEETGTDEHKSTEEQSKQDSVYHNDYRFALRLRVHYRINEEAIRCLLLLRWGG